MIYMTNDKKQFFNAVVSLFKAVPQFTEDTSVEADNKYFLGAGIYVTEEAAKHCFVNNYKQELAEMFGYDILAINKNTFYSSFEESAETEQLEKLYNVLIYYFSVFVPEQMGIGSTAVIPAKDLQLPENDKPVKVTVITSISNEEIGKRVHKMLESGVALKDDTLKAVLTIAEYLSLELDLEKVRNKEFKMFLYKELGTIPENPVEFLRYMIYLNTTRTLLIKDNDTIRSLKYGSRVDTEEYFKMYFYKYSEARLSSIFLRFKPLFLAMKSHRGMAPVINRLRKLAITNHKAKKAEVLDVITSDSNVSLDEIARELEKVTIYKKVSLYNALSNRLADPLGRVFQIRNGKMYLKLNESHCTVDTDRLDKIQSLLEESIISDVEENIRDKTFYIPDNVSYAVPASEKKLFNGIPFGTRIRFSGSTIFGIHWYNIKVNDRESRVDLDLHVNNKKYNIGWYSYFNDENAGRRDIIFSGDMVNAPISEGGAAEAMYIDESASFEDDVITLSINRYSAEGEVPFKLFIGECSEKQEFENATRSSRDSYKDRKYIISAHEMSQCFNYAIDDPQQTIGFIRDDGNGNRTYYVTNMIFGRSIVSKNTSQTINGASALVSVYDNSLSLEKLILMAGGTVVHDAAVENAVSLAPENLAQDTILGLMTKQEETKENAAA